MNAVEDSKNFDDETRLLNKKPQEMDTADDDNAEEDPKAPEDKRELSDREKSEIKELDDKLAKTEKSEKRNLGDDDDKENEEQDVKNQDKKQDDNKKKEDAKDKKRVLKEAAKTDDKTKRRLTDKGYISNYAMGSRNRVLQQADEKKILSPEQPKNLEFPSDLMLKYTETEDETNKGYNLAAHNEDENSNNDFRRISLNLKGLNENDVNLRFIQKAKIYGWKNKSLLNGTTIYVAWVLIAMYISTLI